MILGVKGFFSILPFAALFAVFEGSLWFSSSDLAYCGTNKRAFESGGSIVTEQPRRSRVASVTSKNIYFHFLEVGATSIDNKFS